MATSGCSITRFIEAAVVLMKTVSNREHVKQVYLTKALQSNCG